MPVRAEAGTNVLIVGNKEGSGGREDALAWKLTRDMHPGHIFIAPGNGGTERFPNTHSLTLDPTSKTEVVEAVSDLKIGLVVIGPENLLVAGLADTLRKHTILTYGPGKKGADLEGSKVDALHFMKMYGIPHPPSEVFHTFQTAADFLKLDEKKWWETGGVVIKADGPANGKGVFVCKTREEAEEVLRRIMIYQEFGEAGKQVVIQKEVKGYEVTVMAIVAGGEYLLLPTSEDHKQIFDHDKGPNTGGMGVIAPHPLITGNILQNIQQNIIKKTLVGLKKSKTDFRGTLYFGIMITADGPVLLEYNTRFGDPEAEAVLPLLDSDFFSILKDTARGKLSSTGKYPTKFGQHCIVVTLAAPGYPEKPHTGGVIYGLENIEKKHGVLVFHAGTQKEDAVYKVAGGRVLMVGGLGQTREQAIKVAYGAIGQENGGAYFENMQFRRDIGGRRRG